MNTKKLMHTMIDHGNVDIKKDLVTFYIGRIKLGRRLYKFLLSKYA